MQLCVVVVVYPIPVGTASICRDLHCGGGGRAIPSVLRMHEDRPIRVLTCRRQIQSAPYCGVV